MEILLERDCPVEQGEIAAARGRLAGVRILAEAIDAAGAIPADGRIHLVAHHREIAIDRRPRDLQFAHVW
ncbi:MAG: hypothetical protein CRU78_12440 [Candidatus Accumulibacter phosphatis]|uniref:Uncharacterized protein n=1 Tax=Candidatus Accumulibacter phosphatis TaxID=327160 RepID=A0A6A7RUT6_9PROT|nr:hypothetical protein [Candidatus Accumulibacter phosphatis]